MIRNSRKICPIETSAAAVAESVPCCKTSFAAVSLMALGLVPLETVDHACFGHAERKPILNVLLQGDVEIGGQLLLLSAYFLSAIELHLESELAHQRLVLAAGAPQPDVALGDYAFSEIQLTQRQQHFLYYAFIHQAYFLVVLLLDDCQRREHSYQSGHRGSIRFMHLAQSELAVMGIQDAISADLVLQRKSLGLELDTVLTGNLGPHVQCRRLLLVWMTKLKDDFRITHRKTIHVGNPPAQNERVVVQAEVEGVAENDFPDFWSEPRLTIFYETNVPLLGSSFDDLAE